MKTRGIIPGIAMALICASFHARARAADAVGYPGHWTLRHRVAPQEEGSETLSLVKSLTAGNGLFLALADAGLSPRTNSGAVFLSSNGAAWTRQSPPELHVAYAVAFGNGRWVAAGEEGATRVSTDGVQWASGNVGKSVRLTEINFANDRFFAGGGGLTFASANGESWQELPVALSAPAGIAFGNGIYAALSGTSVSISTNATDWTVFPPGTLPRTVSGIVFNKGKFFASADGGTILSSADGRVWQQTQLQTTDSLAGIAEGNGALVVVGGSSGIGTQRSAIWSSTDGETWVQRASPFSYPYIRIAFQNGVFVALTTGLFAESSVAVSSDGIRWRDGKTSLDLNAVAFGDAGFVAVGASGLVMNSPNGRQWREQPSPVATHLHDVCFGQGIYLAVGAGGTILSSTNGADWAARPSGTILDLNGAAFGAGRFVAVGGRYASDLNGSSAGENVILTSTNGLDWSRAIFPDMRGTFGAVDFENRRFLAAGSFNYRNITGWRSHVFQSVDGGLSWTNLTASIPPASNLQRLVSENGAFVAVGTDGFSRFAITLTNGANPSFPWPYQNMDSVFAAGSGFGSFIALSPEMAWTSPRGQNWSSTPLAISPSLPSKPVLYDVTSGAGSFVAVGASQTILQSDLPVLLNDPRVTEAGFSVSVQTAPGVRYALEYKTSLDDTAWQTAASTDGVGEVTRLTDVSAPGVARFYRIRAE